MLGEFPDITRILLKNNRDGRTLRMLRNLLGTSTTLRNDPTLQSVRNELQEERADFLAMTARIAAMVQVHLGTPLGDNSVLDDFLHVVEGRQVSRLHVLKTMCDEVEFHDVQHRAFVKGMHTIEYLNESLAMCDLQLFVADLKKLAIFADIRHILFKSVDVVFECTVFQLFSTTPQNITSKSQIQERRWDICNSMSAAGVFVLMFQICTQYPSETKLLYIFMNFATAIRTAILRPIFSIPGNVMHLQCLIANQETDLIATEHSHATHTMYANLMQALFHDDEGWARISPKNEEVVIVVAMMENIHRMLERQYNSRPAMMLFAIICEKADDNALVQLFHLGWIHRVRTGHFQHKTVSRTLVARCIAALYRRASQYPRR